MQIAHKIELQPNNQQMTYFKKACGASRFVWNWGLAEWTEQYEACKENPTRPKPSGFKLKKQFNAIKAKQFPWLLEVTKYAAQQPFIYLQKAFQEFFNKNRAFPKFKKKGRCKDSFYVGGDQIQVIGKTVRIPRLGRVKMREYLRFSGNIRSITVSRQADRWYVSFSMEIQAIALPCKNQANVGVDLGIHHLATLSTGEKHCGSKPLKKLLPKLKRYQRQLSKSVIGSKSRFLKQMKFAKLHRRAANIRQDTLHKLTTYLTDSYNKIAIEDLNIKGMLSNHKLARCISDMGFYEFKRQLLYKAQWKSCEVILADRFFPSSKTCSHCGEIKKDLSLSDRVFKCPSCNYEIDRDVNAAINLRNLITTESSSGINACGQDGSV
jgi:putative transposase